jgi:cation diffusion facilitator family transporter
MIRRVLDWFGFGSHTHVHGNHGHGHDNTYGHTHGVVDPSIATTDRGIWAIKWSFLILAATAVLQLVVVYLSHSVALLADTIHNIADAGTAIPLWVAFALARRKPTLTFPYGYGRVEDFAGLAIVLIILFSALVAGYQAVDRLIHPHPVMHLGWLAAAGVIGFLGNKAVAVFRIRVGRQINSAALIADGYHARPDGLTSLAVVLGAFGVWMGFPLADPIVGLIITIVILGIVWQSAKAVLTRMLDGVESSVTAKIRHAAERVPGITSVTDARARWIGHKLHADVAISVEDTLPLAAAMKIAHDLKQQLLEHTPALQTANVTFEGSELDRINLPAASHAGGHHHAPDPFRFKGGLAEGVLEIVDTPDGERMQMTLNQPIPDLTAMVVIERPGSEEERLALDAVAKNPRMFLSTAAPAEPHEFDAGLHLSVAGHQETLPFQMTEPVGHDH